MKQSSNGFVNFLLGQTANPKSFRLYGLRKITGRLQLNRRKPFYKIELRRRVGDITYFSDPSSEFVVADTPKIS